MAAPSLLFTDRIKQFRILVFMLLISTAVIISGCKGTTPVKPGAVHHQPNVPLPAQESINSTVVFTDSGKTKAVLKAGMIRVYDRTAETILDSSVRVDFYNPAQLVSTVLTSKRGKVDDRSRNLFAYEDVVVRNDSGVVLNTEELMWDNGKSKIITDKFVTITTKTEKIQGYGFESDQFLRNYIIFKITYVTASQNLGGGN